MENPSKNMDCARAGELASEYVEGSLPGALGRMVQMHADGCDSCRHDLAVLRELWAELDALPVVEPPPFFRENLIARIEQQERETRRVSSWRSLFPQMGRLALGTAATGLAVAAVAWTLMLPGSGPIKGQMTPTQNVLPGQAPATVPVAPRPRLIIAQARVVDPVNGPAYEFVPRLEGADRGTVRIHLLKSALSRPTGEETGGSPAPLVAPAPLPANPNKTPPDLRAVLGMGALIPALRVPLTAVPGEKCISLYVYWTAGGEAHSTYLFVPLLDPDAPTPPERQSFGLPTERLPEAARALAARYGQAVTLEDVPADRNVTVVPLQESLPEVLGRTLAGTGLDVSPARLPESGLRIAPAR